MHCWDDDPIIFTESLSARIDEDSKQSIYDTSTSLSKKQDTKVKHYRSTFSNRFIRKVLLHIPNQNKCRSTLQSTSVDYPSLGNAKPCDLQSISTFLHSVTSLPAPFENLNKLLPFRRTMPHVGEPRTICIQIFSTKKVYLWTIDSLMRELFLSNQPYHNWKVMLKT